MGTMKKLTRVLTALALCLTLLPVTASADDNPNNHDTHDGWNTITGTQTLNDGNYYLNGNVTGNLTISGNVTLCLNGHALTGTGSGPVITVQPNANFTLCDCNGSNGSHTINGVTYTGGVITGGTGSTSNPRGYGGGILVNFDGTSQTGSSFTMYGGTIAGNSAASGGGVSVLAYCSFDMYGGTITDNTANSSDHGCGGGVYASGTFNMYGGTISGNHTDGYGDELHVRNTTNIQGGIIGSGTIYIYSNGTLNISGGYIGSSFTGQDTANITGGYFASGAVSTDGTVTVAGQAVANSYTAVNISQGNHYGDTNYDKDYPYAVYQNETPNYSVGNVTTTYGTSYTPNISGNDYNVAVSYSYQSGGTTLNGLPTAVGTYTVTATFAPYIDGASKTYYPETNVQFSVTISRNPSSISISDSTQTTYTYGETITISGTVTEAAAANDGINAITDPAENYVGLYTANGTQLGNTVQVGNDGRFTLEYNTAGKAIIPSTTAQTLTVRYGGSTTLDTGSTDVSITLNPKSVTATVTNDITKVYDSNTSATVFLAVAADDLVNSTDDITVTGTGTYASADVGTGITVTVSDIQTAGTDKEWYTVSAPTGVTGSITRTSTTGGGSSDPSYSPSVDAGDGGEVSTTPRTPHEGDDVTITVDPDPGYEVDEVIVTDRNGNEIDVTDNGDGTYTFEQPRGRVTIEVTFREIGAGLSFVDVPETFWAYDEITWAWENGYINGTTATTFSPNASISRQQVWMIMARISGDDPANMAEARIWAMDNDISDGTNPGNAVTRQQLAALLYRYATLMGYANDHRADLSIYPDAGTVASYAVEPMQWSVANGIITGTSDGRLNPTGTATRAQFTVMLYRFWEQI